MAKPGSHPIAAPKPPGEFTADARKSLVAKMLESIDVMPGVPMDLDTNALEARALICEPCEALFPDGCSDCKSCGTRWKGWRKRLLSGECLRFRDVPAAQFQVSQTPTETPQRKVNDMYVYLYGVTFTAPDAPDKRRNLRVVAPDIKAVLAVVDKAFPGAAVLGVPVGQPVDAIADGIISADIQPAPRQTQPMTPEQAAAMGQ